MVSPNHSTRAHRNNVQQRCTIHYSISFFKYFLNKNTYERKIQAWILYLCAIRTSILFLIEFRFRINIHQNIINGFLSLLPFFFLFLTIMSLLLVSNNGINCWCILFYPYLQSYTYTVNVIGKMISTFVSRTPK